MVVEKLQHLLSRFPEDEEKLNPLVLIPTFNNGPYAENLIEQLIRRGMTRYLLLDGGSEHPQTLSFLDALTAEGRVITLPDNPGPRYFHSDRTFFSALPEVFCVTDPDLEFNPSLPNDFVPRMVELSEEFHVGKVGFALDISGDLVEQRFFFGKKWRTIREWEQKFWNERVFSSTDLPVYRASIDTTFAVYNKKYFSRKDFFSAIRVAGPFTAKHLPWHQDNPFRDSVAEQYTDRPHSTWTLEHSHDRFLAAFEYSQQRVSDMENSLSWKITAPLRAVVEAFKKITAALSKGKG